MSRRLSATLKGLRGSVVNKRRRNSYRVAPSRNGIRFPRVAKAQPWAGIGERFQRYSFSISLKSRYRSDFLCKTKPCEPTAVIRHCEPVNRPLDSANRQCAQPNQHSGRVNRHSETVNQHSGSANRHSGPANRHSAMVNRHSGSANRRSDFANHYSGCVIWNAGHINPRPGRVLLHSGRGIRVS